MRGPTSFALAVGLFTGVGTATRAGDAPTTDGTLVVSVTERQADGTDRALSGVELELVCDNRIMFEPTRTDDDGTATFRAPYSRCRLSATSPPIDGTSYFWVSKVSFSKHPVKLELSSRDAVVAPVILHTVDPKYPEALRAAGTGGSVKVEFLVRRDGTVGRVQVLSSSNPSLNQPVIDAVKQQRYKPAFKNGLPIEVTLTQRANFGAASHAIETSTPDASDKPISPTVGVVLPVQVVGAHPVFPPEALAAKISGSVIVQAVIDKEGNVTEAKVEKTTNPVFNEAAIAAVKLRRYEPATKSGKPIAIYFMIRVDFKLER